MKFYFKKLQLYLELAIRSWERHSLRYSYSLFFFFFFKGLDLEDFRISVLFLPSSGSNILNDRIRLT